MTEARASELGIMSSVSLASRGASSSSLRASASAGAGPIFTTAGFGGVGPSESDPLLGETSGPGYDSESFAFRARRRRLLEHGPSCPLVSLTLASASCGAFLIWIGIYASLTPQAYCQKGWTPSQAPTVRFNAFCAAAISLLVFFFCARLWKSQRRGAASRAAAELELSSAPHRD